MFLTIKSTSGIFLARDIDKVIVPGTMGRFEILEKHANLIIFFR